MIIRKLNIYGFGKHENLSIEFSDGINVLYGLNEAGKTTIQQFILHILFGFPSKNQQLLRYEPKTGLKYGGQVLLETDAYGHVTVERVKGKAAGDVTVYFADGTRGGEAELQMILHHYDRQSFESIFSFSLLQLQDFDKMDEMELSRTLLASGTTGVDSLTNLEKQMQKEMDTLFKPSGKKPEMNKAFEELRELETELKDAQKQIDQYSPTVQRIKEIEGALQALSNEEIMLRSEQSQLARFRQAAPLLKKQKEIDVRLQNFLGITFPPDGIRRMDKLENRILDTRTAIEQLDGEMDDRNRGFDRGALSHELESLQDLLTRESEWHQWRSAEKESVTRLKKLKAERNRLMAELGISDSGTLTKSDLSIAQEEKLHSLVNDYKKIEERTDLLQRQEEQMRSERKELGSTLKSLSKQLSPEEEEVAAHWPNIQRKLSEAKAYVALSKDKKSQSAKPIILLMVLTFAGILLGMLTTNWPVTLISAALLVVSWILFSTVGKKGSDEKLIEMEAVIKRFSGREEEMDRLYETVRRSNNEQEQLALETERLTRKIDSVTAELENTQSLLKGIGVEIDRFVARYQIVPTPSHALLPTVFKMMREFQSASFEISETEQEMSDLRGRIERRYADALLVLDTDFIPEDELYGAIRKRYAERMDFKVKMEQAESTMAEKAELKEEKVRILAALLNEQKQLLDEADTESIEVFYEHFEKHKEKEELLREKMQLNAQLEAIGPLEVPDFGMEEAERISNEKEKRLNAIHSQKESLQEEKVRLEHVTGVLLKDESYGLKLQEFEMKKAELADMAKRWSVYKSVSVAIHQMLQNLKENKLPAVLERAQFYFEHLSEGRYSSLQVDDAGLFEAVGLDGIRYSIAELSQATKEQAYISLRFALAESLQIHAPFPIIMDDPFVHFDRHRLGRMVKLMSEMQLRHQFLYFTCHDEMTNVWEDATVILVNREKGAISI